MSLSSMGELFHHFMVSVYSYFSHDHVSLPILTIIHSFNCITSSQLMQTAGLLVYSKANKELERDGEHVLNVATLYFSNVTDPVPHLATCWGLGREGTDSYSGIQ